MNFSRYLLGLLFFSFGVVSAQDKISLTASIEKNKILIGEQVRLIIEAVIPAEAPISFVSVDTIDHFEMLGKPQQDTINTSKGTTIKGIYTITSFDSGHWVIPAFVLDDQVKTDTIPVEVVFTDFNPDQEYHGMKDIEEVPPPPKNREWWYAAAAGLLLLLLLGWLLFRKKKKVPLPKAEIIIDPYQEATKSLRELQIKNLGAKEFYSELSAIFRLYVFRKKGILSLQKTTDDLVFQLQKLNIDRDLFSRLSQSLQVCDYVKFAKYIPSQEDNRNTLDAIQKSIDEIENAG